MPPGMDPDDEAPPPYSAVDPLASQTNNNRNLLRLRGGNAPQSDSLSTNDSNSVQEIATTASLPPANFTSAAAYFAERPPPVFDEECPILEHQLTIYHRSQSKDFPRRPRCWGPRTNHITQQDWDTFLRYLFPPHLGLASTSAQLSRQIRAQIQRDRKDRPQETDEQRRVRISAVITEWNRYFFEPRAVRLVFVYVTDPRNAPLSPLCPRCYPSATKVSQENRSSVTQPAGRGRLVGPGLPPIPGQPMPPANMAYPPAPYAYPNTPVSPTPYAPYGAPPFPHAGQQYPFYHPQPHYQQPWGWNAQPWPPQHQSSSPPGKGGPLGWIASLASQAQKYGERISEQAEHYGRQVEEQALAHGRWIEEQAGLQGRKMEDVFSGFGGRPREEWPAYHPNAPYPYGYPPAGVHPTEPPTPITPSSIPTQPPQQIQQTQQQPQTQEHRPRRGSAASISSVSSFSSIDSLSTTSELSASDLATVRAQLLSLDEHHDRDLHDAAVDLRRQLDVLRESRRQTRLTGRCHPWRMGSSSSAGSASGRTGWGRWESPQQQQRSRAERRAIKEEVRATRKAFRDVSRRAREEQRDRRRKSRGSRRRHGAREKDGGGEDGSAVPLDQRMQNLELADRNRESRSTVQTMPSPTRSVSEISTTSSPISTPSTASLQSNRNAEGKPGSSRTDTAEKKTEGTRK
ncbi:hypothetical protein BDV59DRAFT_139554 [Aspergillus ambiguus]|uniref:uncharacterized protein n=1 Tax=Aspergillus ambiguus TaxID=176160 RepID=UPI003CCD6888